MKAAEKIIGIANNYLGQQEETGNSGFKNDLFEKKMIERGFVKGDPWCALFIELVLFEAYQGTIYEDYINRLCSKSAVETWKNFRKDGPFVCDCKPEAGTAVIWQYYKNGKRTWRGHAGIVVPVLSQQSFSTIEGNGNSQGGREGFEVVPKNRYFTKPDTGLRILGFIHPVNLEL